MQKEGFDLQKAFVLTTHKYRETSLLVDLFCCEFGRLTVIVKGVRSNSSRLKGILQPFLLLMVNWYGKGSLPLLRTAEIITDRPVLDLKEKNLFCGFYLNELLIRILHPFTPCPSIFKLYEHTLNELAQDAKSNQIILRIFEKQLLALLGYGLTFSQEIMTQQPILPDAQYQYVHQGGFKKVMLSGHESMQEKQLIFSGSSLVAIDQNNYSVETVLQDAKRLMRLAFQPLLGEQPLRTRELFF
jgi:DNA repair protein RecO (recombination protein O)